jgi:hypothetical protein
MKLTTLVAINLFAVSAAFGQSTVNFQNNITGSLRAQVYGTDAANQRLTGNSAAGIPAGTTVYGGALLAGTGFTAELWGAGGANVSEAVLLPIAKTYFRTGSAAGLIDAAGLVGGQTAVVVPNAPIDAAGTKGTFQLRAWDNNGGTITTWALALAGGHGFGKSTVFSPPNDLGLSGTPPASPPNLTGLTSFNLTIVPEPGVIALSVLGLGALLLRRRK